MLAATTPDHYLPLLYVIGARQKGEALTFPVEGVGGGSISMLAVRGLEAGPPCRDHGNR
jgi:4,5-DOPA dioxygenase extradiol